LPRFGLGANPIEEKPPDEWYESSCDRERGACAEYRHCMKSECRSHAPVRQQDGKRDDDERAHRGPDGIRFPGNFRVSVCSADDSGNRLDAGVSFEASD
jgi:hypothetical protein